MSDFPPPGPPPAYPAPTSSGKAVAALVLGILGLVACGPLAAIPAVIVGNAARREIDASAGAVSGRGLATAGVVLGWIEIGIAVVALIVVALVFVFGGSIDLSTS